MYGRQLLLETEQLTGKMHDFVEYWAGEELVPSIDGNVLEMVRSLLDVGEYLAVRSVWFEENFGTITPCGRGMLCRKSRTGG